LKELYGACGFTFEFLLCNEFLNAKPESFKGLEEYLSEVKRLDVKLKAYDL